MKNKYLFIMLTLVVLAGIITKVLFPTICKQVPTDNKTVSIDIILSEFVDETISDKRRDQIVTLLQNREFEQVAEKLLPIIVHYTSPMYPGVGPKPWMGDFYPARAKIWYAASAVWKAHISGKNNPEKASCILNLLDSRKNSDGTEILLNALKNYQWINDAEPAVFNITQDSKETLFLRGLAIETLLSRCEINKYLPYALEIINEHTGRNRASSYVRIAGVGNKLFSLSDYNKKLLIKLGFKIMQNECKDDWNYCYGIARQIGGILKIPTEFKPDQTLEKYQCKTGLNDEFFKDTVKNALEWYKNNESLLNE